MIRLTGVMLTIPTARAKAEILIILTLFTFQTTKVHITKRGEYSDFEVIADFFEGDTQSTGNNTGLSVSSRSATSQLTLYMQGPGVTEME